MSGGRIILSINTSWNIVNFRGGLIRALIDAGYEVVAVAPTDAYSGRLRGLGCRHVPLPMDNQGTSLLKDLVLFLRFRRIFREEKPDVFLGFTVKPNVYGSLAAHSRGIPVVNNIAGLGTAFIRDNWLTCVVKALYRAALYRSAVILFQNHEDRQMFIAERIVPAAKTALIPGSGVDVDRFRPRPQDDEVRDRALRFLIPARLLWDKGIGEFVAAARLFRERGIPAHFQLLGFLDVKNRTAISREDLEGWIDEGVVEYLGATDDVRPFLAQADCIVLPSYREGTPRALLEAAAMEKPLIATDVPGCREVVEEGINGFLCPSQNAEALFDRMAEMIALPRQTRSAMGRAGRRKVRQQFDEKIVIDRYLMAVREIVARRASGDRLRHSRPKITGSRSRG